MKKTFLLFVLSLLSSIAFGQQSNDISGTWKFQSVSTSNPDCKSVDYFPIESFTFSHGNEVEFNSSEGTAKASYKQIENTLKLFNFSEEGLDEEGQFEFKIKSINSTSLILTIEYECGSIDILFKK